MCLCCIFFIHSSVNGHLGCLHKLVIVNNAAVSRGLHISFKFSIFMWKGMSFSYDAAACFLSPVMLSCVLGRRYRWRLWRKLEECFLRLLGCDMKAAIGSYGFGARGSSVSISSYLLTCRESQWSSKGLLVIRVSAGNRNQLSASWSSVLSSLSRNQLRSLGAFLGQLSCRLTNRLGDGLRGSWSSLEN